MAPKFIACATRIGQASLCCRGSMRSRDARGWTAIGRGSRIASRELAVDVVPEPPSCKTDVPTNVPAFEELVGTLPQSQREVLTMLKVSELSLEEVARATSSTVGAVKQKAHRPIRHCATSGRVSSRKLRTKE